MNVRPAQQPLHPDAGRLWAGGAATAVVAALAALVGILIARGLAHVAILAPKGAGAWGDASTTTYVILSGVAALAATGLLHFLLVTTPRATQFFGWIMVLLTAVAMVLPLSLVVDTNSKIATALLNLLIGLAITIPLVNVAAFVVRPPQPPPSNVPPGTRPVPPPPTRQWDM